MSDIILHPTSASCVTCVSNIFIDEYMVDAHGEYVKVYLYLLRCVSNMASGLSVVQMADTLEHTQKDIKKALHYWERCGLLQLEYDEENDISGIFLKEPVKPEPALSYVPAATITPIEPLSVLEPVDPADDEDAQSTLYLAEKLLGHTLSPEAMNTILYWHDGLSLSWNLIEYIIEHCVENGTPHINYINKVALNMAEGGITSVEEAKASTSAHTSLAFAVMRAFGINNRSLAKAETAFVDRWNLEYGFSVDMIIEACNRTIMKTHQPSFEYADSILRNWRDKDVRRMEDLVSYDQAHTVDTSRNVMIPVKNQPVHANNRFRNFTERNTDYSQVEKKLYS